MNFAMNVENKSILLLMKTVKRSVRRKDENPGLWDTLSFGMLTPKESYEACAHRELAEEPNLKGALETAAKISSRQETYDPF